jgi:1-acyl-sn-glycerol-3-phosphate acyltransferase
MASSQVDGSVRAAEGGGDVVPRARNEGVRRRQRLGFWYRLVIHVAKPLMLLLTKRDWRGAEHIPAEGGIIVAANHVSEIDPLVIGHFLYDLRRAPRFLAKAELFRKPPMKWIVEGAKQIPVSRHASDASAALVPAVEALARGECVLIYPEGSATRDPDLWPMKARTGVARVALMSGAPVIPVAMWGPEAVLPYKARRPMLFPRRTMRILAGPPVDLSAYVGKPQTAETLRAATDVIMRRIADQLAELRGGVPPAEFYDMKAGSSSVKEKA